MYMQHWYIFYLFLSQSLDIFGSYMKLGSSSSDSDKNCLFRTFAKTEIMQFPCLRFTCTILLNGWFTEQWLFWLVVYCLSHAQVATRLIDFMSQSNRWSVYCSASQKIRNMEGAKNHNITLIFYICYLKKK